MSNDDVTYYPNYILDEMGNIGGEAFMLIFIVIRLTLGELKESAVISVDDFKERTRLSYAEILKGIKRMLNTGFVQREPYGDSFSYRLTDSKRDLEEVKQLIAMEQEKNNDNM